MAIKYHVVSDMTKGIDRALPASSVAWANGRNVRFTPGHVEKMKGATLLVSTPGGLPVRAVFTFVGTDGNVRTIVCCDSKVYAYNADFTTHVDITPSPAPTGGPEDAWEFALVSGLPVLTNGKNLIWKWPSYVGELVPLAGAPLAKHISSCMHRLVVSNIVEGDYAYPGRVRWSEMGNPENWTIDTTGKSGRYDLVNLDDSSVSALANIKRQAAAGSKLFLFTERGLWVSDFSQGVKQFIPSDTGAEILSPKAACRAGDALYWIGKKDVYRYRGDRSEPIGLPIRKDLFDSLNEEHKTRAFAFSVPARREIWLCVATGANTVPDTAYVFNEELEAWSIADVGFSCGGEANYNDIPYQVVGTAAGDLLRLDYGDNSYAASTYTAIDGWIETGDMHFGHTDLAKAVSEVLLDVAAQEEVSELMVRVGVKDRLADEIRWSDPEPFTIGVSDMCDFNGFRREGKHVRLRIYSDQKNTPWRLAGFTVKYEPRGTR